jgi:hypothetical protein
MSSDDELFTSAEILGGFSAKCARLLLFQYEFVVPPSAESVK